MYILEANGEGLIEVALENGAEIQINVSEVGEGKAHVIVCAGKSVLLSLEHLKVDPRELFELSNLNYCKRFLGGFFGPHIK